MRYNNAIETSLEEAFQIVVTIEHALAGSDECAIDGSAFGVAEMIWRLSS